MSNVDPTLTFDGFGQCDMVIEAVFEDIKIKHAVIKEVEQVSVQTATVASQWTTPVLVLTCLGINMNLYWRVFVLACLY